jgi:hypothetical protein
VIATPSADSASRDSYSEGHRYLKSQECAETAPPEMLEQITEALRELKLCSDIGNFAIGQQFKPNRGSEKDYACAWPVF